MSTLQINNQHKRKQTLPERMFALAPWDANCRRQTTGASQARSLMAMGATQRFAAVMFVFVFLASGVCFLHPFSIDNSYAETATSSTSVGTSVNLDPNITIWTTNTSDSPITAANIAASPDESVATTAVRAHVSTNNLTGYTLTIQSNSTDAKMKHENTSVTKTIDPITGSGTSSSAWAGNSSLNNMWGYSIGTNDSFVGVPGSSSTATTIDSTDAPNNDNYTDITFATKADLSLPAGTYTDTVIFSAVANAIPVEYMQDADASWCSSLDIYDPNNSEATTYTLKDKRDNQEYKVRRLYMNTKNANSTACWMVENLRLTTTSLTANGHSTTLDSSDTNLSANFTLSASDSGAWCTSDYSSCDDKSMMIDAHTSTYPESYLYNWYAATAGTGTYSDSSTSSAVEASICPGKGANTTTWHLPSGNTSGEWYYLYNAYKSDYGWSTISGRSDTITNNLSTTIGPNFVYSGFRDGGSTYSQGSCGRWWSRTAVNNNNAYNANLDNSRYVFGGTDYYNKYYGFAVRCVLSSE